MKDLHMTIENNYVIIDRNRCDSWEILQWAKKHCPHYITNQYHNQRGGNNLIDFYFLDCEPARQEMTMMILRWA